jgi:hypothetical protein
MYYEDSHKEVKTERNGQSKKKFVKKCQDKWEYGQKILGKGTSLG